MSRVLGFARSPQALEVRDLCAFGAFGVEKRESSREFCGVCLWIFVEGGREVCGVVELVAMAAAGLISNLRVTKTGAGSRSLAEAQDRATHFFREACRALPSIMDRYYLYDVITLSELRTKIASEFRKHHHNTNPKVIDMLVFKGREELQYCIDHSKQRHHLLSQYIIGREGLAGDVLKLGEAFKGESEFLKTFYRGNN